MSTERPTIHWTVAKRERFRLAYNAAVVAEKEVFEFESQNYVTAYAKYLLIYLDQELPRGPHRAEKP